MARTEYEDIRVYPIVERRMDEALLKHDTDLYASLNDVYRLKWHFVKRYRATGHTQVRIMRMLEAINNLKKRLIRCGDKL